MINKIQRKLYSDIHSKEILSGSLITFVLKITGMLLGYLVVIVISRKYGPEGIGLYNLSLSILMLFVMISSMGINISILRYVGEFNKKHEFDKMKLLYQFALEFSIPLSITLSISLYLLSDIIGEYLFTSKDYALAFKFIALILPFMTLHNISIEYIRGIKKIKVSEYLRSINIPLINLIFLYIGGIYIAEKTLPLYTVGLGIVVSSLIALGYIVKRMKTFSNSSKKPLIVFQRMEFFKTSFSMMIISLSSYIVGNVSLYVLSVAATTKEVGIFSVSFKIAMLISLVLSVVNTISAPKFSELYWNREYDKLQSILHYSSKMIFYSSFILSIIIIVFRNYILELFGTEFIVGSNVLIILVIAQLINSVTGSVGVFLNMSGNQKILQNILIFTMFLSIILNLILIPIYGINGAGFAMLTSSAVLNVSAVVYVKYKLKYITYYQPNFMRKKND